MKHAYLTLSLAIACAALAPACASADDTNEDATEAADTAGSGDGGTADAGATDAGGGATDGGSMRPIAAQADPRIVSTLGAAGISLDALPDLTTLKSEPGHARLRAVMKSFTIALGTTCSGCHVANAETDADFAVDTRQKKIARNMWAKFVGSLARKDGSAIYCDTCHQGSIKFLVRDDHHALASWMKANFVQRLARKDGEQHGCMTCHGDPFNGSFLDDWAQ